MKYLKKYWLTYNKLFILSLLFVGCEAACDLIQPRIMSRLIDNGAAVGDLDYVLRTGLTMLMITGIGAVFALSRNITASIASHSFGMDLRQDMFAKIQSLSVEDMDRFDGGSLITRMTNDVTQLQNFINGLMRVFFKAPIMCLGGLVMAASLNLRAMPIVIPVVALVVFVIVISMKMTYPRFARVQDALDKLNTTVREYLAGIRLVKAFRRFEEEGQKFSRANDVLTDNTVEANRIIAVLSPFLALFVNLGIAAIIFLGSRWVDAEYMKVGEIMAFITYMTQILNSLNMISNILNMFVRVKTSNERISEVMSVPPPVTSAQSAEIKTDTDVHIEFDNVGFSYKGSTGQAALTGLTFTVARGNTLGVIGSTGSGKSTLAALLMRFYDATEGEVRVSGAPVNGISEEALRAKVAIVPQTASLFTGTIKDNILWGKADATDEEVVEAARTAEAHDFISASPDGYGTMIGQSGVNLSGGQKQRVSIARALVRRPEILVLDDCTSALDVVTEAKVKRALRKYARDMTCVLITQRVSAAMTCDKILVLDNGRQTGFGTHAELMQNCEIYRDIFLSQIGKEVV